MTVFERWQKCPHTPKQTRAITDKETGFTYELCSVCHISRRVTGIRREGIELEKGEG